MLTNRIRAAALIAVIVAVTISTVSAQKGYDLFQQALVKERAEGRPDEAIALYQRVFEEAGSDRALKAKALVQMASCYQKVGSSKATDVYLQVLREYADQPGAVADARAALSERRSPPNAEIAPQHATESEPRRLDLPQSALPSPDGLYTAILNGNDLTVRHVATSQGLALAHGSDDEALWPFAWSPDSQRLAYVARHREGDNRAQGELRLINRDGTHARTILQMDRAPSLLAWSPDGGTIAYQAVHDTSHVLELVSVADGTVRTVKTITNGVESFTFSPDGQSLVYDAPGPSGSTAIHALAMTNGVVQLLISDTSNNRFAGWTPAGGLLFTSDRAGTWDLWLAHLFNGRIDGPPVNLKKDLGPLLPKVVTTTGSLHYVTAAPWTSDVYTVSLDVATSKISSQPTLVHQGVGHSSIPRWSPDGRQLAFKTGPVWQPWPTIATVSMDTGEERQLTPKVVSIGPDFGWSFDSRYFLNNGFTEPALGKGNLYRIDARTGELTPITPLKQLQITNPQAVPDGRSIMFVRDQDRIVRRDLETGQEQVVLDVGPGLRGFTLSPSASMAAFVFQSDKTPDKGQLRVATLADGRTRTLVELTWYQIPFHGRGLSWSPDGRYILYFDRTSDKLVAGATVKQSELWRIPVAGGPPERLGLTGDTLNFPALSPDGRSLAFIKLVDRSGYWALENFLPASELRAAITSTAR